VIVDVAVVGGGPGGAAAAIELARAGRSVALFDKSKFPRDKACGDGLTASALRWLEYLGLDPRSVATWKPVTDVSVRSPGGRTTLFPLPRSSGEFAVISRRRDLDAALLDTVRAAGTDVRDGHGVVGADFDPARGAVDLSVEGIGRVSARYALAADGMWSPLRKMLGGADSHRYLGEWHAFRQYFRQVSGPAANQLMVWFDSDLLPGYAWAFPLPGNRANVGFGIIRDPSRPTRWMRETWRDILMRPHVKEALGPDAEPEEPAAAWPIPARLGSTQLTAAGGRVLFVGDAARATDPMTGEGIGQALETGITAARAVLEAGWDRPGTAAYTYEAILRHMARDHAMAHTLSNGLASPLGAEWSLRIAGATAWTRRNFARWLFEDYPRALLLTPSRWRRGMFSATGAYR
jgi:geranylgeranyl reductase family protein